MSISPLQKVSTLSTPTKENLFLLVGPIGPHSPEGRPGPAAVRHMRQVEKNETVVVRLVTGQTYTWATIWRYVRVINTNVDGIPGIVDQTCA